MAAGSSDRDSSAAESSSEAELSKGTADSPADSAAAEPTPTVDHTGADSPSPAADAEPEPASASADDAEPAPASTGAAEAKAAGSPTASNGSADTGPTDPVAAPTVTDDAEPATASTDAANAEPADTAPAATDAADTEPAVADAADTEPAVADAADTELAASDSTESADEPATESSGYPPALIATAVALPVVLVVAVLVAAVLALRAPTEREPLVLGPVPAPAADGPACAALLPALPVDLGEYSKSTLVEPAPPATRAWQRKDGGDAIVLRCGLERPLEFNRASPLQIVDGVQWFEVRDAAAKASTWFAVDRPTYIALTVPDGSGPTPLQGVSDAITANIPAQPIDPGPLPN
ncbi:DUF3515 family protein [Nocardia sp. CA-135953]|uniref:DUF3515 domain-containing protein n=1 Tax=Nocardia sp. CA-135953 TaxID=3239978 RepID=UPI003D9618EA